MQFAGVLSFIAITLIYFIYCMYLVDLVCSYFNSPVVGAASKHVGHHVKLTAFYSFVLSLFFIDMILQDSGKDPHLPLVDSHAQHLIQKRIAVEKLSRRSVLISGLV